MIPVETAPRDGLSKTKDIIEILCAIAGLAITVYMVFKLTGGNVEDMVKRAARQQAIEDEIRLFGRPLEEGE